MKQAIYTNKCHLEIKLEGPEKIKPPPAMLASHMDAELSSCCTTSNLELC